MKYKDILCQSITNLSEDKDFICIGQGVKYGGTFLSDTYSGIPNEQKIEFPVSESFQMQFSLGLALAGRKVLTCFPRENFLLLSLGDLVNTLDKITELSEGDKKLNLVIRTAIGPTKVIYAGIQHSGVFHDDIAGMLVNTEVIKLTEKSMISQAYNYCFNRKDGKISLIVEYGDLYDS